MLLLSSVGASPSAVVNTSRMSPSHGFLISFLSWPQGFPMKRIWQSSRETLVPSKMSTEDGCGFNLGHPFTPSFWRDLAAIGKLLSWDPWTRNWSPASTEHKNKSCQQPHWVNVEEDILLVEPACESPGSWCISCGRSYAIVTQLRVPGWKKKCHCFEFLDARATCLVAMDSQDKWQGNEANLQGLVPLSEGKSCHRAGVAEIGPNWRPDVLFLPSLSLLGWFPSQASRRGLWFFPSIHKDTRLFRGRWLSSLTPL